MKTLTQKYQEASDDMLNSLKRRQLTREEKVEWYGYIRAVRDCAYDAGILDETTLQKNLEEASKIVFNIEIK